MNRKKKVHAIFKKKLKKAKARMNPSHKPKYISKAERAKLESTQAEAAPVIDTSEVRRPPGNENES
ncbi:MAG: DUF2986 domain-containing protein [Gammaproteobacteria bacterium]|nr:MAG: DUF2986 domain-containing protein [Gammaproteobacteria bacterium]